jgi:hypothetical protein
MKPKRKATNWRKIYEACAIDRDFYKAQCGDFLGQIEVGDALLDKQRERLIRLTEIKNLAGALTAALVCTLHPTSGGIAYELNGTLWSKYTNFIPVIGAHSMLSGKIAALEVDTAIPQKGDRP